MLQEKFDPFSAEWISFAKNPRFNLIEKCLKLAQILEYPDMNIEEYVEKIQQIGKTLKMNSSDVQNPTYKISMLNEFIFEKFLFKGNEDDYYDPANNFLNIVIDKKIGIPLTLSVIYVEIAKYIGLDLKIVGFPGHVLVKFEDEMILDPFFKGRLVTKEDLEDLLIANFGEELELIPEYLNSISDEQVIIRLLRNLKNAYSQSYAFDKAMRCTNMVLGVFPDSPEEIRDKGILEEKMFHYEKAIPLLNRYLELDPEAEDADFILELIKNARERI